MRHAFVVGLATLLGGCVNASYVAMLPAPDGDSGSLLVANPAGQHLLQTPGQAVSLGPGAPRPLQLPAWQVERDFVAAQAALPPAVERYRLYFEGAGLTLTERSEANIGHLLNRIRHRAPVAISVIGHTDRLGGRDLNHRTGLLRAQQVADRLRAEGIQASSLIELRVGSHGEDDPLIDTPDETAEPRNRRVEVMLR
ncbi:OmpA family protein [Stutzerimonas urumqiensis]|uniref:OmpA family protein n=1 Tax=Stutzerimonas urumqiensis TaxID=638269 RepID=UPI003DA344A0